MSFDRVAPHYRRLETFVFGRKLQTARVAFVRRIAAARHALVVGEGNGRFLEELVKAQPALQVDCIDASAEMIKLARARVPRAQVQFVHADLLSAALPAKSYDLVVTHFFLDCFAGTALSQVIAKLSGAAMDDATWLIADFSEPRGWRRFGARLLIATMYLFFRLLAGIEAGSLVEYAPLVRAEGFALTNEIVSASGLIRSRMWQRSER